MTLPPMRPVVSWWTPDPRHPFFKDLKLDCGHTLAHRKLVKGRDGRYHVPRQARCTCCKPGSTDHPARPIRHLHAPAATPGRVPEPSSDLAPVGAATMPESSTYNWSARDRAARNWD